MRGGRNLELVDLVKRCQLGNMEAFNELYKLYNTKALRTVYLVSGRKGIAEDVVQEAFIQCFLGVKNLKRPEKFNCWFYSILTRNTWKMVLKNKNTVSIEEAYENGSISTNENIVEETFEKMETYDTIQKSLDKLSLHMKTTVVLHYYNDMSISDIAKILGCFEGTVKSRLHNARKLIKKDIGQYINDYAPQTIFKEKECSNNG